jgi:hypothetical protein
MAPFGGHNVTDPLDGKQAKAAVDAICAVLSPDYVMLLDGPDVVPHVMLERPSTLKVDDPLIASDLPYATAAPFSTKIADCKAVTRAVGRLPAAPGAASPDPLIAMLDAAAAHRPRNPADHRDYFALSAEMWEESTTSSLKAAFGRADGLLLSPDAGHPAIDSTLGRLTHYINCHGQSRDPRFFGQALGGEPTAMESAKLAGKVRAGTVVATECCFGAQLYDNVRAKTAPPICITYLAGGAAGFLGSTDTSFGDPDKNVGADLMAQFFVQEMLSGASLGRALIEARQAFIRARSMMSAINEKTLAQFLLLGDPSLQPCLRTGQPAPLLAMTAAAADEARAVRKTRRLFLHSEGVAAAEASSSPGRVSRRKTRLSEQVAAIASRHGFADPLPTIIEGVGGAILEAAKQSLGVRHQSAIVIEHGEARPGSPKPIARVLTAHIVDGRIVGIETASPR